MGGDVCVYYEWIVVGFVVIEMLFVEGDEWEVGFGVGDWLFDV